MLYVKKSEVTIFDGNQLYKAQYSMTKTRFANSEMTFVCTSSF